jgi:dihydropteroate synthase-like protein
LRILVVTGLLTEKIVKEQISGTEHEVDLFLIPVPVAAFISSKVFLEAFKDNKTRNYDLILFPGGTEGDLESIESSTGIPTFKGPYHAAEIKVTIENLNSITLSKKISSSELLKSQLKEHAFAEIKKAEENWREQIEKYGGFTIGAKENKMAIGPGLPIKIIAEIVNAPSLDEETLKKHVEYRDNEGADIIDIGMLAGNPKPERVRKIIETIRESTDLPLSIDSLEPTEINAAIDSKIDLIMSIDEGNMEHLSENANDIPVVVLPSNLKKGIFPRDPATRIEFLEKNIKKAKKLGYNKIIADPVLEPPITPGIINSLKSYMIFREHDKTTPVLMGIGNVVEMIDIDSVGVNGLLTAIGQELDVQLLHVPEHSVKATGSIKETQKAKMMTYLAEKRKTVVKDLGIELLKLKEKRRLDEEYDRRIEEKANLIRSSAEYEYHSDESGWFKINIDRMEKKVVLSHFPINSKNPDIIIKGKIAREIYLTAIKRELLTRMDHAAYLGKELMKAELALLLERSYIQDEPLFR